MRHVGNTNHERPGHRRHKPQKDIQLKKITLIGISNGIASQFTDQQGNLNVDMPIKIIENRQVNGETVEEIDFVRVTARGNTAQKLASIVKDSHVYI